MSDLKSTTGIKSYIKNSAKKIPLKLVSAAFLYFHRMIEFYEKKYAKDLCQKLVPNPLLIFLRDCQQITFVRLNACCLLSKSPPPPPHPPVLNRNINA